jgi:hypothetical protein
MAIMSNVIALSVLLDTGLTHLPLSGSIPATQ